jgi:hypothetical protein
LFFSLFLINEQSIFHTISLANHHKIVCGAYKRYRIANHLSQNRFLTNFGSLGVQKYKIGTVLDARRERIAKLREIEARVSAKQNF